MAIDTTLLVADLPEAALVLRQSLTAPFTVREAATLDDAKQLLAQEVPSLVVCGCHFDDGRMYDLLRHLKATARLSKVPYLAVRCLEGELDDSLYESVKIAVRALGGSGFVDLRRWQGRYGVAEANHRLTRLVETLAEEAGRDSR
jgi:CheY-like chemotaxis protein